MTVPVFALTPANGWLVWVCVPAAWPLFASANISTASAVAAINSRMVVLAPSMPSGGETCQAESPAFGHSWRCAVARSCRGYRRGLWCADALRVAGGYPFMNREHDDRSS